MSSVLLPQSLHDFIYTTSPSQKVDQVSEFKSCDAICSLLELEIDLSTITPIWANWCSVYAGILPRKFRWVTKNLTANCGYTLMM